MILDSVDKLFIGKSKSYNFYFIAGTPATKNLHDVFKVKTHNNGNEELLVTTLVYPLSEKPLPSFNYKFCPSLKKNIYVENFYGYSDGFVHARNSLQDHFRNGQDLDIVVFDHGYDVPPFPGGKIAFFEGNPEGFKENNNFINYPPSFTFGGCSGDWDGDGYPELMIFNLFYGNPKISLFLKNEQGKKMSPAVERLPDLINSRGFIPLAGTKFKDSTGSLHLALGSMGNDFQCEADIILRNNGIGYFLEKDILAFPIRRMGDDWCCVSMKTVNFHQGFDLEGILAVYHDATVQNGYIELYYQQPECQFTLDKRGPVYQTENAWISKVELVKIDKGSKGKDGIMLLKSRGIKEYVPQDFYVSLLYYNKEKGEFVDKTDDLLPLKGKEFSSFIEIGSDEGKASSFVFFDSIGNQYFCEPNSRGEE